MNAFADVTAQLPGVLTSDGADLNTAEFLLACRCIIPIIGAPTPVDILRLRSPRPARTLHVKRRRCPRQNAWHHAGTLLRAVPAKPTVAG